MTRIHLETRIEAPIERACRSMSRARSKTRSMAHTGEEAIAGRTSGPIGLGETVTWRARHLGRWWTLTSRITVVERPTRFADEQASGPFARFEHTHTFGSMAGGTLMTDDWDHTSPFGPLGRLADRLFLGRHMRRLLETRNAALKAEAEGSSTPT